MAVTFSPAEVQAYYSSRLPGLSQRGREWRGPCPIHGGKRPNFAVNSQDGEYYCHSACNCGGDMIALEMALTGVDFKRAKAEVFRLIGRPESVNGHSPHPQIAGPPNGTSTFPRI